MYDWKAKMVKLLNGWKPHIEDMDFDPRVADPHNSGLLNRQKTLKLSIINQFYPPDYAAKGQCIQELAAQLVQLGVDVQIVTGQPGSALAKSRDPGLERSERLQIKRSRTTRFWSKRIRSKPLNGLLFFFRAGLHLVKAGWRGDVLLLTSTPPFLPILGYLAHLCFGVSYICLIDDLYPDVAVALNVVTPQHWLARFWDALNHQMWRRSSGIVVLCSTMKDRAIAKFPELADKISVIHNWADPNWIRPLPKTENWFVREHGLANQFTVLYSGNLGRCHDMDTILEAAAQLQHEPIQFLFIGDGAKRTSCLEKVRELGLQNCRFLPDQEKHILPYSLTAGDVSLVSIAKNLEGLVVPSQLYGILASGRPVAAICEPHSYLCQLLKEANCGATFVQGNSEGLAAFLRFLSLNPQQTEQMGRSGRRYLKSHFTPETIAQQYLQVLQSGFATHVPDENLSVKGFHPQAPPSTDIPIGQRLKQAGLISEDQVSTILAAQQAANQPLRFGEILVQQGILPAETIDFFANTLPPFEILTSEQPLGYYLKLAKILNDRQIDAILAEQHQTCLRFGEVAVRKGWISPETLEAILKKLKKN
jgi:glycosyltransferase involved in cell wall biosynthesis